MTRPIQSLPVPAYRSGDRCPCCNRSCWYIGRVSVECARCGYAVRLARAT